MTKDGWRLLIKHALNDEKQMELLIELLIEYEEAKKRLRNKGYGCLGTTLIQIVNEVPSHFK